jgi:hypothetical protein
MAIPDDWSNPVTASIPRPTKTEFSTKFSGASEKVTAPSSNWASATASKTAPTIDKRVAALAKGRDIDLLSIDLDGNDYYILEAIKSISPRVIVAEYNSKFPPDVPWIIEYNESHRWDSTDYFGASLKSLHTLLSARGYSLVACNVLGTNAFFVRTDLVDDKRFCAPFSPENHYEPSRYFLLPAFHAGYPVNFGPFRAK